MRGAVADLLRMQPGGVLVYDPDGIDGIILGLLCAIFIQAVVSRNTRRQCPFPHPTSSAPAPS